MNNEAISPAVLYSVFKTKSFHCVLILVAIWDYFVYSGPQSIQGYAFQVGAIRF